MLCHELQEGLLAAVEQRVYCAIHSAPSLSVPGEEERQHETSSPPRRSASSPA